jgi:RNA polymerase sigma-70 factor (ECF subfamily)
MSNIRLINGARAESLFETLMGPHFSALHARAYQLTGNEADAEDLVQDLCVRVYPRVGELRDLDNPRAWLMRILYRLCIDLKRRQRRTPLQSIDAHEADESVLADQNSPSPEQHTNGVLMHRHLKRAWRVLDGEQRVLLVLQGIEGYSLAEIEEMTGIPQGTLKSRLHRARARLGRLLERYAKPEAPETGGGNNELSRDRKSFG